MPSQALETLELTGTAAIDGTGNRLDNILTSNGQDNVLNGAWGRDTLTGNGGANTFVFDAALNAGIDTITDFAVGIDTIRLSASVFGALAPGALQASEFAIGKATWAAGQHILYTWSTGALSYDADGVGGAAAVQFAQLQNGLSLGAGDFEIV